MPYRLRWKDELLERNWRIVARQEAGQTYRKIGEEEGISRERVRQILFQAKRAGVRNDELGTGEQHG